MIRLAFQADTVIIFSTIREYFTAFPGNHIPTAKVSNYESYLCTLKIERKRGHGR